MKYYHHINQNGKGGTCLAYYISEHRDGNNLLSRKLVVAASFCSNKDVYCKKTGRNKANFNIENGNVFSMPIKGTLNSRRERVAKFIPFLAANLNALFQQEQ